MPPAVLTRKKALWLMMVLAAVLIGGMVYVKVQNGAEARPRSASLASLPAPFSTAHAQQTIPTTPNLKGAFIGDSGVDNNASAVLQLIKNEGAEFVLHAGDLDYSNNPTAFENWINNTLGPDYPYFVLVGNHDVGKWRGAGGYQDYGVQRINRLGINCTGDYGVKALCEYKGLAMLLSGVGLIGNQAEHEQYIQNTLSQDAHIWRICSWHEQMKRLTPGNKGDSTGYRVYDICREQNAFITNGHAHVYGRTRTLTNFANFTIDPAWQQFNNIRVDFGSSWLVESDFVKKRAQTRCFDWPKSDPSIVDTSGEGCHIWASIYTTTQQSVSGALFITFNVNGNPNKAEAYYKNLNGQIIDQFTITNTAAGGGGPTCTPGGTCTTNNCPGTYICQSNQRVCQDTPGDNCPSTTDTTPPTASLTFPLAQATVSGTITITAAASDNVGVSRVEFLVDGSAKGTDLSSPYSYLWDTTNAGTHPCSGAHTHTLTAKAYDAANNAGTSASVVVNMNNPPHCTTPPPSDTTPPSITAFDVQPRSVAAGGAVTVSWTIADTGGSHVKQAEVWNAPFAPGPCDEQNKAGCTWGIAKTIAAPANADSWTSQTSHTPHPTVWYGLHVPDNAGNVAFEPAPIKVTATGGGGGNTPPNPPLLTYVGKDQGGGTCGNPGQSCTIGACPGTCDAQGNSCVKTNPQCGANLCGNGQIDAGEQCDGTNLNGTSCTTLGFTGGALTCNGNCTLNTSQCTNPLPVYQCSDGTDNDGDGKTDYPADPGCTGVSDNSEADPSSSAGIWTSPAELSAKPMSGPAWDAVIASAGQDTSNPDVANQDDPVNVRVLAAAIVYARTGDENYRTKVVTALEVLIARGNPGGRSLAWARETGAYALAADLIGYRTPAFESWLRNMSDGWRCSQLNVTLRQMFKNRPNNWGSMAFGSLAAIYAYLGDTASLNEIRDYWIDTVSWPYVPTQSNYGTLSWQYDESQPRWINPAGATKNCPGGTINIDGIIPDDTRRGGDCQVPPVYSGYMWEGQQGFVMAGRIFERLGMSIWDSEDQALLRTVTAYQMRWAQDYGTAFKASGDDLWMLPFYDRAYNKNFAAGQGNGIWGSGKNTGWAYVLP